MPVHTSRAKCIFVTQLATKVFTGRQTKWQGVLSRRSSFQGLITMDRRIELIISKIETETAFSWDTRTLARMVDLSPSRFRHLFKQETGSSPAQYLKDFRVRKAEVMLRTTFLSVKQILKRVGIRSNSHFVRDFRKMYGMTPTAYRRTIWRAVKAKKSRKRKS